MGHFSFKPISLMAIAQIPKEFFPEARVKSQDFLTNIVLLVLTGVGITSGVVASDEVTTTITELVQQNWEVVFSSGAAALLSYVLKVVEKIKAGSFSLGLLWKDSNFLMKAITILAALLALVGIMLPETAPQVLIEAFQGGTFVSILTAIATQVLVPLYHFFFRDPKEGKGEGE